MESICYRVNPPLSGRALNTLFATAWPNHQNRDFAPVLARSLAYVSAFAGETLVGFVNLAWDGGVHAFVLDTTVHCNYQRQGIGRRLVEEAATLAKQAGIEWLHVDCEPDFAVFYQQCGFSPTCAGLRNLKAGE